MAIVLMDFCLIFFFACAIVPCRENFSGMNFLWAKRKFAQRKLPEPLPRENLTREKWHLPRENLTGEAKN